MSSWYRSMCMQYCFLDFHVDGSLPPPPPPPPPPTFASLTPPSLTFALLQEKETSDLKLKLKNLTEQNLKLQNSYQMVEVCNIIVKLQFAEKLPLYKHYMCTTCHSDIQQTGAKGIDGVFSCIYVSLHYL